jgi:hypothetical protein
VIYFKPHYIIHVHDDFYRGWFMSHGVYIQEEEVVVVAVDFIGAETEEKVVWS